MGVKPIREKILEKNYLFALEFSEGFLFGRTVRRRICQYKPYPLITSAGVAVDIAATSHQAELWFRDPRNTKNDILYLDESSKAGYPWFFHGAIGINPQFIRGYLRFPEGKEIPGKFPNADPIKPSSGDKLGYINSLNSPYEEPTDHVEIVIPPKQHIGCEYYNVDDRAHQPVLHLYFALYFVKFFHSAREKDAEKIRRIANREYEGKYAEFFTAGWGDTPIELGDLLKKDWGVTPLSLEAASNL